MRIENGYLQQSMLCSKNNRNAVGNFSDAMNKVRESISNKVSTKDMNQLITYQYEADRMNRQWYSVLQKYAKNKNT